MRLVVYFAVFPPRPKTDLSISIAPVAFEEFLSNFKTTPEQSITHDLGNITIDEDELSDEYDFADEDEDTQDRRRQERRERAQRRKGPHHKYREILQDLADRKIQEVTVDLDDLADVRLTPPRSRSTLTPR